MVQMPAMNTPQFDWVRSRLPHKAQPVPPIYQPEVGAEAVVYAAHHDVGRELLVGWPTVKAVTGNKVAPAYIDRRLARDGAVHRGSAPRVWNRRKRAVVRRSERIQQRRRQRRCSSPLLARGSIIESSDFRFQIQISGAT
jgi:hypothetical protein